MTDYQPGRIYSGVIDGERKVIMRTAETRFVWADENDGWEVDQVSDIRGPLVVLDLDEGVARTLADALRHTYGMGKIADEIEAQTKPPLQVGWHECHLDNALPRVLWWDGEHFLHAPHGSWVDKWRSVAYLGKGTRA